MNEPFGNSETDFPDGTTMIEIRGIYDGWCAAQLPDGRYVNRWPEEDRRHKATQEWIDRARLPDALPDGSLSKSTVKRHKALRATG